MKTTPGHKIKSNLHQLIQLAIEEENVSTGKNRKSRAAPTAATTKPKKRIGILREKSIVPDDVDAPLPDDEPTTFGGK